MKVFRRFALARSQTRNELNTRLTILLAVKFSKKLKNEETLLHFFPADRYVTPTAMLAGVS